LLRGIALELAASDCQTGGMDSAVMRLLSIAHRPLSDANPGLPPATAAAAGPLAGELVDMLTARNGFFAFGPALHVFPCESSELSWGLVDWNMPGLWKHEYLSFVDPGLCFAEDIFGNQFSIKDGSVHYFEVETGALKTVAASLDEWADLILADDQLWTGWPFAERWAEHDAPVPPHVRLHPATPFVCGGSYEVDNLRPMDAAEMMAKWGSFARQIHRLPEGAQIKIIFDTDNSR
jgi:hypothetical protein